MLGNASLKFPHRRERSKKTVHEQQELTACVEFARGAVMLLGYKLAPATEASVRRGYSSYILVVLRRERCRQDSLALWEHSLPGYYPVQGRPGGVSFHLALRRWESPEQKLRGVIQALKSEEYLDREQELRAYIGLGLAYP
jgi:hypothetical protein